jgi:hypothetical protein
MKHGNRSLTQTLVIGAWILGGSFAHAEGPLPAWLKIGGEERIRSEAVSGASFKVSENGYLLERLRLNVDVKPLAWLKFSFQAQDSRVFGTTAHPAPTSQRAPIDVRVGYVELGTAESIFTLRAGRQPLDFGDKRLLADPAWSNVGRTFDAARGTFRIRGMRVDAFSAALVRVVSDGLDDRQPGEHLHGLYTTFDRAVKRASIEPYVFWRLSPDWKTEAGRKAQMDEKIAGLRWAGQLPLGIDYRSELVAERGQIGGDRIRAWAGTWAVGHTLADPRHEPRLYVEYNVGSGDANAKDGRHGTFDILFPSSHDKFGLTDIFCWANIEHFRSGASYRARKSITLAAAYNSMWLQNTADGLYLGGKLAVASNGKQGSHVGHAADVQGTWAPARATQFTAGYARVFPGEFLHNTGRGVPFNIVFVGLSRTL